MLVTIKLITFQWVPVRSKGRQHSSRVINVVFLCLPESSTNRLFLKLKVSKPSREKLHKDHAKIYG